MPQQKFGVGRILPTSEMLKMVLSKKLKRDAPMNTSTQDRSFPYVLVCSTAGTIISLVSVWVSTAMAFSPVVGA
jgi:hypothetical protein